MLCPTNKLQSVTVLDAGSVIPDLIRDRHDGQKSKAVLNYGTACCTGMTGGQHVSDLPEISRFKSKPGSVLWH